MPGLLIRRLPRLAGALWSKSPLPLAGRTGAITRIAHTKRGSKMEGLTVE
jgi:hypothetical protein